MNTERALVVIDMQPHFPATRRVLKPVISEVQRAMKHEVPILIVELHNGHDDFGITHEKITEVVEGYPHVRLVHKAYNDGSSEVRKALSQQWGLGEETSLEVCGVNTEFCVKETVQGLQRKGFADITVLANACAGSYGHTNQIYDWRRSPDIKVA